MSKQKLHHKHIRNKIASSGKTVVSFWLDNKQVEKLTKKAKEVGISRSRLAAEYIKDCLVE